MQQMLDKGTVKYQVTGFRSLPDPHSAFLPVIKSDNFVKPDMEFCIIHHYGSRQKRKKKKYGIFHTCSDPSQPGRGMEKEEENIYCRFIIFGH